MAIINRSRKIDITHILVVRLTDLGESAMSVHSLRGLRKAYPELRITVLTDSRFIPLFRKVADLNFISSDDVRYKGFGGMFRLCRDIRRSGAQAIADLEASRRSRHIRFSLIPYHSQVAVIERGRLQKELMTRKFRKVLVQLESTPRRCADVFARLGFPFDMPAPVRRNKAVRIPPVVTILAGTKRGKWVGVAPMSKHKGKFYPIPQTDKLIEMLSERCEKIFIFGTGKYERQFGEGMEFRHKGVVSVVDRVDVEEQLDLLTMLDAVVTMDTPVLRMASLVGTPAVSIWGATHPFIDSCGYGQDPRYTVQLDLPCRPCSVDGAASCMFGHYECLTRITPLSVIEKVDSIIGIGQSNRLFQFAVKSLKR